MRSASILTATLLTALTACSAPPKQPISQVPPPASAPAPVTFTDRIWTAADSTGVPPGQTYLFRSDGALLITSPHGTPAVGQWRKEGSGLVMVEEGISYPTDIVELSATGFRIRSHNPGGVLDIRLIPADAEPGGGASPLTGTTWRLEDLAGTRPLAGVEATLQFAEDNKVAGRASCNRYFGTAELSGESIHVGALGSTKMACADSIMIQETNFLQALQTAERFSRSGDTLLIYSQGRQHPLRFTRG